MKAVKSIQINHSKLGIIDINTKIPNDINEYIGDVVDDYGCGLKFYHASVSIKEDGGFDIKNLSVIKPDSVNIGFMNNSKGIKNFISVVKNMHVDDSITVYPSAILSVIYEKTKN